MVYHEAYVVATGDPGNIEDVDGDSPIVREAEATGTCGTVPELKELCATDTRTRGVTHTVNERRYDAGIDMVPDLEPTCTCNGGNGVSGRGTSQSCRIRCGR